MRSLVEQLRASNTKLNDLLTEEQRWGAKPLSSQIRSLKIGPLTKEVGKSSEGHIPKLSFHYMVGHGDVRTRERR